MEVGAGAARVKGLREGEVRQSLYLFTLKRSYYMEEIGSNANSIHKVKRNIMIHKKIVKNGEKKIIAIRYEIISMSIDKDNVFLEHF